MSVQAAGVKRGPISEIVVADAVLFPIQQAAIVPKISAPVQKFYVNRGAKVRAGQLLAMLENKDLQAAATDNQGAYEQAQASYQIQTGASFPEELQKAELDVKSGKEALDAQQKVYNSRETLYKQGALPRRDLDQAAVALVQARSQYDIALKHLTSLQNVGKQQVKGASGALTSAKGKYQAAQAQLSYSEIRSPINGVVTDRPLFEGEIATAGTPLITVMDLDQIIAKGHIPQEQAALIKKGDQGTLTVPGSDHPVQGRITLVSPALDPNSTTVEVWAQAANPGRTLRPGTTVKLSMVARTVAAALMVPASALLTAEDSSHSVMIIGADGRASKRDVKTGIQEGDQVQIVSGVKSGEQVVTTGAYGLPDNTKVRVESSAAAQPADTPQKSQD